MAQAFSMHLEWKNGNPHMEIKKQEGEAPDNGPSLSWKNGHPHITLIVGQYMEIQMPKLSPGEEMPYSIEVIDPETGNRRTLPPDEAADLCIPQ